MVRGVGLIHSVDDIRHTMIAANHGAPVVHRRCGRGARSATCRASALPAYDDDDDIVQGIVLMRRGAESMPTIKRVEAEVDKINSSRHAAAGRAASSASTIAAI